MATRTFMGIYETVIMLSDLTSKSPFEQRIVIVASVKRVHGKMLSSVAILALVSALTDTLIQRGGASRTHVYTRTHGR